LRRLEEIQASTQHRVELTEERAAKEVQRISRLLAREKKLKEEAFERLDAMRATAGDVSTMLGLPRCSKCLSRGHINKP